MITDHRGMTKPQNRANDELPTAEEVSKLPVEYREGIQHALGLAPLPRFMQALGLLTHATELGTPEEQLEVLKRFHRWAKKTMNQTAPPRLP